jgi:hypothetical protein
VLSSRFIDGPRLGPAARTAVPHGVAWLPPQPQVNQEECDLYLPLTTDPGQAVTDGIPSPSLFLLAHLDRNGLAAVPGVEHIVQVRVPPGGAIDVPATEVVPPRYLREPLADRDVYLLPAGWLDRARLVAAFRVGPGGQVRPQIQLGDAPVILRCAGASHGAPGLPNEVERWPRGRLRSSVTAFIVVDPNDPAGLGQGQRLYQRRPDVVEGARLLQIRLERGRAIDVAATAEALAGFPAVRTSLSRLVADGVDFLIPPASYARVAVDNEFRGVGGAWRRVGPRAPRPLDLWRPVASA